MSYPKSGDTPRGMVKAWFLFPMLSHECIRPMGQGCRFQVQRRQESFKLLKNNRRVYKSERSHQWWGLRAIVVGEGSLSNVECFVAAFCVLQI